MVGGGTLALRMGKQCGMKVCFVESGRLSLKKAIRQAESIIYARQREKLQLKCFSSAASSIQEGNPLHGERDHRGCQSGNGAYPKYQ